MNTNSNELAATREENYKNYNLVGITLLVMVLIKLFYIFYMTMRGNEHGYPFDTYLFHTPDRFVDYIGTRIWAMEENPWDPNSPLLKMLQAAPYGPVSFYYMRFLGFIEPLLQFMILVFGFLFLNYQLFSSSFLKTDYYAKFLIFVSILVGFYPLHFIIDRGNIEILPAFLFSALLYYGGIRKSNSILLDLSIILIACAKFVWLPILAIVFFLSFRRALLIIFFTLAIYVYPIIFNGVTLNGYFLTIINSYKVSGWALNFSHNIFHGVQLIGELLGRPIGGKNVIYFAVIGALFLLVPYLFLLRQRFLKIEISNIVIYLFLSHIALSTMIFSNPSFDYRLIYFLPIYFYVMYVVSFSEIKQYFPSYINKILVFAFCLSVCWFNFFTAKDAYSWYMPIRAFSILIFDLIVLYLIFKITFYKKNNDHI
jgi:hypothetical protein